MKLIDEDGLLALIKAAPEPATSASPRAPEALAQAAPPLPSAVSQLAPAGDSLMSHPGCCWAPLVSDKS